MITIPWNRSLCPDGWTAAQYDVLLKRLEERYQHDESYGRFLVRVAEVLNQRPGVKVDVVKYYYQFGYLLRISLWNGPADEMRWVEEYIKGTYRYLIKEGCFEKNIYRFLGPKSSPIINLAAQVFIQMVEDSQLVLGAPIYFNGELEI